MIDSKSEDGRRLCLKWKDGSCRMIWDKCGDGSKISGIYLRLDGKCVIIKHQKVELLYKVV